MNKIKIKYNFLIHRSKDKNYMFEQNHTAVKLYKIHFTVSALKNKHF